MLVLSFWAVASRFQAELSTEHTRHRRLLNSNTFSGTFMCVTGYVLVIGFGLSHDLFFSFQFSVLLFVFARSQLAVTTRTTEYHINVEVVIGWPQPVYQATHKQTENILFTNQPRRDNVYVSYGDIYLLEDTGQSEKIENWFAHLFPGVIYYCSKPWVGPSRAMGREFFQFNNCKYIWRYCCINELCLYIILYI